MGSQPRTPEPDGARPGFFFSIFILGVIETTEESRSEVSKRVTWSALVLRTAIWAGSGRQAGVAVGVAAVELVQLPVQKMEVAWAKRVAMVNRRDDSEMPRPRATLGFLCKPLMGSGGIH